MTRPSPQFHGGLIPEAQAILPPPGRPGRRAGRGPAGRHRGGLGPRRRGRGPARKPATQPVKVSSWPSWPRPRSPRRRQPTPPTKVASLEAASLEAFHGGTAGPHRPSPRRSRACPGGGVRQPPKRCAMTRKRHPCRCSASRGLHGQCARCGGPIPVRPWMDGDGRAEGLLDTEDIFDVADRNLGIGDVFRWPCSAGAGARAWRIVAILDPEVDELLQRVRATPVRRPA